MLPLLLAGCASYSAPRGARPHSSDRTIKPVLAVMDFENSAGFSGQWNLGGGLADVLVTELLQTEEVVVLERKHLNEVVGEILRQGEGLFRKEGRVEKGRLKNAQFLLRGVVTDFTVTGDTSGWFGNSTAKLFGRGSRARVAILIKVSDVESGEIISSIKADGAVSAGGAGASVNYKNITFGGDAYFRTPLGRATEAAIHKAVKQILRDMPDQFWKPRVAESGPDEIIINGGGNMRVKAGDEFVVRDEGRTITDPVTGNVLETQPGKVIGRVRVTEVLEFSSHARVLEGEPRRGQILEMVK
ncbi:MAG: CsgG/HfaB family protein [Lentisphaerota bacterium]